MASTEALRQALKEYRLSRGMSYEDLASDMRQVVGQNHKLSLFTLRRFIEGETEYPHVLTCYAIEQYLKAQGVAA